MKKFMTFKNFYQKWLVIPLLSGLLALGIGVTSANATGVYDLPTLGTGADTMVLDSADVISVANEGKLNRQLNKLAKNTGNEVRFVVIRRLDFGETIDSFADSLFESWYPTPEAQSHQTLLVLDTLTNNLAIRTGEDVQTLLSDEMAQSVAFETARLPVSRGNYNQALLDSGDRLIAVLSGQPDPGAPSAEEINIEGTFTSAEETDDQSATLWVIVLVTLASVIPMATYFWYAGFPGR